MLCKSKAIVLHQIPYAESNHIVHFYTQRQGRLACMVRKKRSKRSDQHASFYQALNQLQIEYYFKNNRQIQTLKESSLSRDVHFQNYSYERAGIVMFIAEVLYRAIREEEKNEELYYFLENTLSLLMNNSYTPNFHLVFLIQLTKYIGIYPQNNYSGNAPYFDLAAGNFKSSTTGTNYLSHKESGYIHELLMVNFENMDRVDLNGELRSQLLNSLLNYYHYHLEGLGEIKSLKVMKDLYT